MLSCKVIFRFGLFCLLAEINANGEGALSRGLGSTWLLCWSDCLFLCSVFSWDCFIVILGQSPRSDCLWALVGLCRLLLPESVLAE